MNKENWKATIEDLKEIEKLEQEFAENRTKINQKVYSSLTEERLRTNKIIVTKKIKAPIDEVFKAVASRAAKDMHPSLNYSDLNENQFYRSSGKTNKIPFKITEFKINEVITIEYYVKDQQFIKTLRFRSNQANNLTKITYTDIATGMVSILGWFEKHVRSVYIKRQIIAFKAQILNAELDLNLIPDKNKEKKKREIERMLQYSQNSF